MNSAKRKKLEISDEDVASFVSITGASDDIARRRLQATNGNLMLAINQHMDSDGTLNDLIDDEVEIVEVGSSNRHPPSWEQRERDGGSSLPHRRPSATSNGGGTSEGPSCSTDGDDVRAPIAPITARLLDPHHDIDWDDPVPRRHSAFDGLRDFAVEADHQEEMLECPERAKKKRTLEDLFRPPIHLMYHGTFTSARDEATNRKRWLLVNIQNMKEFSCQVLNRDIWSDNVMESIIREQFVFWQVYSDSGEGKRFMRFYNVSSWPYVAILDPRTGECLVQYNHVVRDAFCDNILTFLNATQWDSHNSSREASVPSISSTDDSASAGEDKVSSIIDASEEQQLEMALAASLREAASSSAAALNEKASNSVMSVVSESEDEEEVDDEPSPASSPFRPEPSPQPDENAPKMCIMLRYPDGKREEASFPSTSSIAVLHQHVASKGFPASRYELVTNFPRRNLSELKGVTLEGADLHARDTVFVQLKS